MNDDLRGLVAQEALDARRAASLLSDEPVAAALSEAAALVRKRADEILAANEADVEAAKDQLDEGMLDRLRLDGARVDALSEQVEAVAAIEPLEREITSRTLENGLQISERRIPIGVVGANFEARPNVALDVAGQLLKSLNTAVLRTGGAALRTVTRARGRRLAPGARGSRFAARRRRPRPLSRSRRGPGARDDAGAHLARHPPRKRPDDRRAREAGG